ncbi:amidase [Pararobbsia silviterrae]|uniref:Amidase n=1 Tax=Pararobbsia silviterrae TaxID=1792498 RepID=A0A494Y9S7_9BURK|nr:amidase [Pararobbsia silviterrae]RKP59441.1 amidase [Pararobbsia silviterrae]
MSRPTSTVSDAASLHASDIQTIGSGRSDTYRVTSLRALARDLDAGRITSRALTQAMLARIADPNGQGKQVFIHVDAAHALEMADAADALRRAGTVLSPLHGVPVSIKDLFDVKGEVTRAGSAVLRDAAPAHADAEAVARLRRAGAVLIGRTNMSEFAFSGVGLNPHYGHPLAPYRRAAQTVSGGSSSGAAASVADGMAAVALGTDTGGSIRIPATFCELTGFKPTARRVPATGAFPLSTTLDSIGPIGLTVDCCAIVDRILAGLPATARDEPAVLDDAGSRARAFGAKPLAGRRFGVLRNFMFNDADDIVPRAFEHALRALEAAGAELVDFTFDALDRLPEINRIGIPSIESYALHRPLLEHAAQYDSRVLFRIMKGETVRASEYIDLLGERRAMIDAAARAFAPFDAVVCPTVPIAPPTVADLADDTAFFRLNPLILRNPSVINFIDGCALSLPCHRAGDAPVGLMLAGLAERDAAILALGRRVEAALEGVRGTNPLQ